MSGSSPVELRPKLLQVVKRGNEVSQQDDAAHFNLDSLRIAVSDGATDSYASGLWSRLLAEGFTEGRLPGASREKFLSAVDELSSQWRAMLNLTDVPWYKREKAQSGAAAAWLGLLLDLPMRTETDEYIGTWRAWAFGDCCLFQVREGNLVEPTPFPLTAPEQFSSTPVLTATDRSYNESVVDSIHTRRGDYRVGDRFILATDAFAQFLTGWIPRSPDWEELSGELMELSDDEFDRVVNALRDEGRLRNDDVTLVIAEIDIERAAAAGPVPRKRKGLNPTVEGQS